MAEITLSHVDKTYRGGVSILEDLNLTIYDEEFLILVGPSGCGKTTTLRLIAGLEEITGGEVQIGGKVVNDLPPGKRDIAMVFQDYALYPHMTVYENMAFGLKNRKVSKETIQEKIESVSKRLEITEFLSRKPKALSGGQRQRIALGRAMVREPSVFLLDEPLSNLDALLRANMRAEISTLHRELHTTFVYVTHDQTEAMTMGDRIAVMKGGEIQQLDTPQNLYDNPKNQFVAGFIGSPQMNFFPVSLLSEGGAPFLSLDKDAGSVPLLESRFPGLSSTDEPALTLGIRPEDMLPVPLAEGYFLGNITYVEHLGAECYAHLDVGGSKAVLRSPLSSLQEGEKIGITFPLEKTHLFYRESTLSLR